MSRIRQPDRKISGFGRMDVEAEDPGDEAELVARLQRRRSHGDSVRVEAFTSVDPTMRMTAQSKRFGTFDLNGATGGGSTLERVTTDREAWLPQVRAKRAGSSSASTAPEYV